MYLENYGPRQYMLIHAYHIKEISVNDVSVQSKKLCYDMHGLSFI